jgi:hypothetical protein
MTLDRDRIIRALPNYEVGDEIGRGAWGVVVSARHRQLDRTVAVKELPAAFASDPGVRRRFVSEARLLATLDHPHIVPIHDYIEDEGLCLLVMELLPGGTVWARFTSEGITAAAACSIVVASCSALHHAHSHGVLHRDIKPDNLLFNKTHTLKVSDFGIAKVVGGAESMGTRTGEVLGTPAYMAPEQALGHELTPATDVYAVGTVLYELLSGRLPFSDDGNAIALLYRHVHEEPVPLAELRADLPASLVEVTMRSLARDPADRYATAEEFGVALAEAAAGAWGGGWVQAGGLNVIATGRIGERITGSQPVAGVTITGPPGRPTRSTRAGATVADRPLSLDPEDDDDHERSPDELIPVSEMVLAEGTRAAATVAGMGVAGVVAGTELAAATTESAAGAAATVGAPGSMASAPGTMGDVGGTMTSSPGSMSPAATTARVGAKKLPLIIGSAVGVTLAVGAFVAVRTAANGSHKSTTTTTQAALAPGASSTTSTTSAATVQTGRGLPGIVTTVAGNGTDSGQGIPGPALAASLGTPDDTAVAPNGDVYVIDRFANRLLKISGGQVSEAYVGNAPAGEAGFSGVAVAPDGSVVFGTGRGIARLDGPNAATLLVDKRLQKIGGGMSLAYGPDGTLYMGGNDAHQVFAINHGTATVVAGNGTQTIGPGKAKGDGGSARSATFGTIADIAVGPDGTIYVADGADERVRAFKPGGTINTVAGGGTTLVSNAAAVAPEGTSPTKLQLGGPTGVSVASDGTIYVADGGTHVIFRFGTGTGLQAVIADAGGVTTQEGKPANQTRLHFPGDLVVDGNTLWFFDGPDLRKLENL